MKRRFMLVVLAVLAVPGIVRAEEMPASPEADGYWNDASRAKVIQQRRYEKSNVHSLGLSIGVVPNDDLFTYMPLGLNYQYQFTESLAVMVRGQYLLPFKTGLYERTTGADSDDLERRHGVAPKWSRLNWDAGIDLWWSPIYGKMALLGSTLGHFDFAVFAGLGAMGSYRQQITEANGQFTRSEENKTEVYGNVGLAITAFLGRHAGLRLEYRQFLYSSWGDNITMPAQISLNVLWFIGGLATAD